MSGVAPRSALARGSRPSIPARFRIVQCSPRRRGAMDDARLFLCARCQRQVRICSRCDRGQQYCGAVCAEVSLAESRRAAGRRYQQTRRGRHCHAERQRRYRARCREGPRTEIVTHQGSAAPVHGASFAHPLPMREVSMSVSPEPATTQRCHFCARSISDFVRPGWRRPMVHRGTRAPVRRWRSAQ